MVTVFYKNYRIFYNEHIKMFCLAEVRYDEEGKQVGIVNPLAFLGETLHDVKETLEYLLSDVENAEKEVIGLDKYINIV